MRLPMPAVPVVRSTSCAVPITPGNGAASMSCDSLSGLARQICYMNAR